MFQRTFERVARSLTLTRRLENRVRPLLDALAASAGLDVALLTRLHADTDRLEVLWCHHCHRQGVVVVERTVRPWSLAFGNKAFSAAVPYTPLADELWPECADPGAAARVCTYTGQPVYDRQGRLFGTLCALSSQRVPMAEDLVETIDTFARLIGLEIEHERLEATLNSTLESRRAAVLAAGARRMARPHRLVVELERVFALEKHDEPPIGDPAQECS